MMDTPTHVCNVQKITRNLKTTAEISALKLQKII